MGEVLLNAIKFCLAILLIPIVIACAVTFRSHLTFYPSSYQDFFLWGFFAFVLSYLFVYQFWGIYDFGQKIVANIFSFFSPFNRIVSFLLPFYMIVNFLILYVMHTFFNLNSYDHYFIFFGGFFFTMHILLVSQELQEQEKSSLKSGHLFMMSVVFIVNIFLLILLIDLATEELTLRRFFSDMLEYAEDIYIMAFNRIVFLK